MIDVELVGEIVVDLDSSSVKGLVQKNGIVEVPVEIEILFGSKTGVLEVRAINSGKVKGHASMNY